MVLADQIKVMPLSFDRLFASSLEPAVQASNARRQQDLLTAALKVGNKQQPRRERSRSLVRRPLEEQGRQPFRQPSCGGRGSSTGRGSRRPGRGTQ